MNQLGGRESTKKVYKFKTHLRFGKMKDKYIWDYHFSP